MARVAAILADIDRAAVEKLLRMVTLAVAVGNVDLHAKNISLMHYPDGTISLAPAYDVVPQAHQPTDGELALAIDQEYRHRAITRAHLIAEAAAWGLLDAHQIIDDTLLTIHDLAVVESPHRAAHPTLAADIAQFAANLLASRAVGDSG